MIHVTVRYDGEVLVPEGRVDLPTGVPLQATIERGGDGASTNSIRSLVGLGADVWAGVDPLEYQRNEREGWE